jgi:ParB-like chromosome segregation protein Spo0J
VAELKKIADGRTALVWFKPERIKVKPGLNGRDLTTPDNLAHIEALAESIVANGFLQSHPLEVFSEGEDVFVSDGHCRLAAIHAAIVKGAKVEKIPCVGEPRGTNDADRILNQDAHNSGKRLTPLELGGNIKRAMALDGTLTVAEIAKRMGRSVTFVSQALEFQAAPAEVHAMVKSGEVSTTMASAVIRKEGATKGAATLKEAVRTAKFEGKAKATAKHVAPAQTARRPLKELRDLAKAVIDAWEIGQPHEIAKAMLALRDSLALAEA